MLRAMIGRPPRLLLRSAALLACTLTLGAAQAAESVCRLEPLGTSIVVSVLDGRSFLLDDGREVRLAGLHVPLLVRRATSRTSPAARPKRRWNRCSPARR
jgi:hypothetical protein